MSEVQPVGHRELWQIMLPATHKDPADTPAPGIGPMEFEDASTRLKTLMKAGELPQGSWLKGGLYPVYRPEDVQLGFAESDGGE